MIQIQSITKEFGERLLFYEASLTINKGERIGLVGRNGSGKSTLFRLINQELSLDEGNIIIPNNYSIATLNQFLSFEKDTILDECALSLSEEEQYDLYKVEKILMGLGFSIEDFTRSPHEFSGGFQIRLNLAKCLLRKPSLLLLDEPTNYLDIVSMNWLASFLKGYSGEIVLITHDRGFMNKVCSHIVGIEQRSLKKIKGDFKKYQDKIREEKEILDGQIKNQEKKVKELERFIERFQAKASKATQANSRKKMLEKMQDFDKWEDAKNLFFKFNYASSKAKTLLEVEKLSFSYPSSENLIENLTFHVNNGDRIAIIGKNGKGKSTLLNLISNDLVPTQGEIKKHSAVTIGYFGQTNISRLHSSNSIEDEISLADSQMGYGKVRSICGTMMFTGDDAKKKIQVLSGGEKSRVLLGKIIATPANLLLLDEPTNHLDQESVEVLKQEILNFPGSTLFVTHNEDFIRSLATKLIVFHHDKVEFLDMSYDDFINKIGWGENSTSQGAAKSDTKQKITLKEFKHQKRKLQDARLKKTSPLKKKSEALEANIMEKESSLESIQKEINSGEPKNINQKVIALSCVQDEIDSLFTELDAITSQIELIESHYKKEIEQLEKLR